MARTNNTNNTSVITLTNGYTFHVPATERGVKKALKVVDARLKGAHKFGFETRQNWLSERTALKKELKAWKAGRKKLQNMNEAFDKAASPFAELAALIGA